MSKQTDFIVDKQNKWTGGCMDGQKRDMVVWIHKHMEWLDVWVGLMDGWMEE